MDWPLELDAGFAEQRVALPGGVAVALRRSAGTGAGIPTLLLHGISSGAGSWFGVAKVLAAQGQPDRKSVV